MQTITKRKPIRSELMAHNVGDSTTYNKAQRDSVTSTRDQLQSKTDMKWTISKVDSKTFKITRIL